MHIVGVPSIPFVLYCIRTMCQIVYLYLAKHYNSGVWLNTNTEREAQLSGDERPFQF